MLVMTMKRLQMNLKFLGYYKGKVNGVKDYLTTQSIKDFQKANGLAETGIAEQKTIDCIRNIICDIQRKVGAKVDGVAGNETTTKKAEYDKAHSWDSIKYFKKEEFTCKCGCGLNNMELEVVKVADQIREHFGQPCIVNSGTRCAKHNKNVGGVSNSRHLSGKAIDLYIKGVNGADLINYTTQLKNQGKLRYTYRINNSNAVHIDIN